MVKKKITNEDLALMMKKGFDGIDERFVRLEGGQGEMKADIQELKTGQEDIKLRLDQAAWRFEMQDLEKRVEVLEKHTGVKTAK